MWASDLIHELQRGQRQLEALSPREFEQLVAELLAGFGWKVNLTPPTRDGGVDIFGVSTDPSGLEVTWIVECKRYTEDHAVPIMLLRQLLGVKEYLGASNGLLVTTSRFTRDAVAFAEQRHDLHRVDRDRLLGWIHDYRNAAAGQWYTPATSFVSCFLSHSRADAEFAAVLNDALRKAGVRVWFAPEDMKPGDKIFDQIKHAIAGADRLLLVLSEASIRSSWVQTELREAVSRERQERRRILFPISLIPFEQLRHWQLFDADSGTDIARDVREYFVLDFSQWRDPAMFQAQLARLIDALHVATAG
jgi:hypothetical protein